ncbi:MAG: energy-coupling factor transporter ATPase [Clostridia bacterium]|nr:energy-coupling factor transporter ATPase [Clostridia bacterium]
MNALEIKNLDFAYEGGKNVLSGINLTVSEGEFVCLLGRNGSGKSTLARLINGLLLPARGSVCVFGMDSAEKKNLFEIRKRAGMVFQNPDNQTVASIVEDDLAFGPENVGVERAEIGERISYALSAVGMEEFRYATPSKLSGGQKQRIAIAGVLALKPDMLILDESTAMLDPKGRAEVTSVVRELNKNGMTVISITHYMDEAVDSDRVIVLSEGKIVMQGVPAEIFSRAEELARYGLNVPKAAYIAKKLRENGLPIAEGIYEGEALEKALCELFQKG